MKTIKELDNRESGLWECDVGYRDALKDVLKLIDEIAKRMTGDEALFQHECGQSSVIQELKARITG